MSFKIKNTLFRYGTVAIFIHWFMALLIFTLLGLGLYMVRLPISMQKLKLFGWHKELGVVVLMLVSIRLLWRWVNVQPLLNSLPYWQQWIAKIVHLSLYGFMVLLPLTGWLMSSAAGIPVSFFGLFVLPDLISPNEKWQHLLMNIHGWLAYLLIFTLLLHIAAALKHYFIDKDDIMERMLP